MACDEADAARNHPLNRFAGFGMLGQRRIVHRLAELKALGLLSGFLWDGFVDVGGHLETTLNSQMSKKCIS